MYKYIRAIIFFIFYHTEVCSQDTLPPIPDVYFYPPVEKIYNIRKVNATVMDGGFGYNMFLVRSPEVYQTDIGGMTFFIGLRSFRQRLFTGLEGFHQGENPVIAEGSWMDGSREVRRRVTYRHKMYLAGITGKYFLSDKKGFNGNLSVGTGILWYSGISKVNQLDGTSSGNAIERNRVIGSNAPYGNIGAGISYSSDWSQYKASEISSFKIELSLRHFFSGPLKIVDFQNLTFPPIPGQPPIPGNEEMVNIITNSLPIHRVAGVNEGPLSGWFITLSLVRSGTINWKKKQQANINASP
jgi:hypothetical protein